MNTAHNAKPVGIWSMAGRNIGRRPRRSFLTALAIGLAALTMVALLALLMGMKDDMASNIRRYFTGDVLVQAKDYQRQGTKKSGQVVENAVALQSAIAALPGVAGASPRIQGGASVFAGDESVIFGFFGMAFATDPARLADFLEPGGRLPVPGAREALLSHQLAARLGLKAGDSLTAITQTRRGSSNGMSFKVTGIVGPAATVLDGSWLFTDIATARRFTRFDDGATGILVSLAPGASTDAVAAEIGKLLPAGGALQASPWDQNDATYQLMDIAEAAYNFIGLFFFALASTVMINTMLMVVLERSREIGTLAALGMDRSRIIRLFLAESGILCGIGAAIGCLLGSALSLLLGAVGIDFSEAMSGMNVSASPILRPKLEIWIPFLVFFLATAVSTAFTMLPVSRINRMDIVASLRGD
jgi:putative ABC transport system permease protein